MKSNYYEQQLVYHCGPTLKGLKAGSMIALKYSDRVSLAEFFQRHQLLFRNQGIKYMQLMRQREHILMLFYRPQMLSCVLRRPQAIQILKEYGYPVNNGLNQMLEVLLKRMKDCDGFPHEIGLFLGYPLRMLRDLLIARGRIFSFVDIGRCMPMNRLLNGCFNVIMSA